MATLTVFIEGKRFRIPISPAVSILNALIREGIPIQHRCGAKAQCGTCKVRVLEGHGGLSPILAPELARLRAVKAREDERLACQMYARRDLVIEIPRDQLKQG